MSCMYATLVLKLLLLWLPILINFKNQFSLTLDQGVQQSEPKEWKSLGTDLQLQAQKKNYIEQLELHTKKG